ncbi:hypothetical protein [Nitrospira sp. M1]
MPKYPFRITAILIVLWPSIGWGMEASPTQVQIDEAIAKGKDLAELWRTDSDAYDVSVGKFIKQYKFGDQSTCNNGDVFTKIRDLVGSSMAAAKKYAEIDSYMLSGKVREISFAINIRTCHRASKKGFLDNQVVRKQGAKNIQPLGIRYNMGSVSERNNTALFFLYSQIDPQKEARLVIIEDSGKEFEHKIDLSLMP